MVVQKVVDRHWLTSITGRAQPPKEQPAIAGLHLAFSWQLPSTIHDKRRWRIFRSESHQDRLSIAHQIEIVLILTKVLVSHTNFRRGLIGINGQRVHWIYEKQVKLVIVQRQIDPPALLALVRIQERIIPLQCFNKYPCRCLLGALCMRPALAWVDGAALNDLKTI